MQQNCAESWPVDRECIHQTSGKSNVILSEAAESQSSDYSIGGVPDKRGSACELHLFVIWVQRFTMVDNSDTYPNGLPALSTRPILASQGSSPLCWLRVVSVRPEFACENPSPSPCPW